MKIIVAGSYQHWNALEKHYVQHLSSMVNDIQVYPWPDIIGKYYGKNLGRRLQYRYKWGVRDKINSFNQAFFRHVYENRPDIVWVFKGVDVWPDTIREIKELGVKVVNYNPDHPFIRTFRSGGGHEVEDAIPLYDLIFSYSLDLMREIEARVGHHIMLRHLPFGYEISSDLQRKLDEIDLKQNEIERICFIGNPDTELRYKTLKNLISSGVPIDIYGHGWKKHFRSKTKNARIFSGVYNDDYWLTLRRYRIQLNIFRPHNFNSHNMRTFEIPAAGGIQLAPESEEHRLFFEAGKEIFLFQTPDELARQAEMLLKLSFTQAMEFRSMASERCRISGYSYEHRARFVYATFRELLAGEP